jgi:hypothetical protein
MEKMENKERFPLSHGTAATICMNLFTKFVALGICMCPPPGGVNSLSLRFFIFKVMIKNYLNQKRRKISTAKRLGKHCFLVQDQANHARKWPEDGLGSESNFLTPFDPLFRSTAIVAPL